MSHRNESSPGNQFFLEIEWGVNKKILVNKYNFGSQFFNVVEIPGQVPLPRSPLFVYPEDRNHMDANPGVQVLKEFYETGSVLPRCSIKAELRMAKSTKIVLWYQFMNVRVLERFGRNGDRFSWFYKLEFQSWR